MHAGTADKFLGSPAGSESRPRVCEGLPNRYRERAGHREGLFIRDELSKKGAKAVPKPKRIAVGEEIIEAAREVLAANKGGQDSWR
jgi:hypothetical protein